MRGVGVTATAAGAVPPVLVPLLSLLTQLGDTWFLLAVPVVLYWLAPASLLASRRDAARLLAVALTVFGVVVALKFCFALPRPPASVANVAADGYGFPSGHATGSAAVYAAGAALVTWRTRRDRVLLATCLILLVCLMRVLLGVHYLVDVAAGVPLGLAVAGASLELSRRRLELAFWAAVLVALAALATSKFATDAIAVSGFSLGTATAWTLVERSDRALTRPSRRTLAVALPLVGGLAALGFLVSLPPLVTFASTAVAGGLVVALPAKE